MNDDPVRWKDASDAPAAMRDLLRDANAIAPMPDDVRAAMLAALPSGPPPVAATSAAAGGAKTAIAVGSVIAGAMVVAAVWIGTRPAPHEAPTPTPTIERSAAPVVEPSVVPSSDSSAVSTTAEVVSSVAPARPPRPAKSASRAEPSGNLAEESALVGRARATLPTNPSGALAIIDEHASRYPRGELVSEREYLRIRALQALHRDSEAGTRARAYLASYPMSPQAPAVREFLSGTKEERR